jgi:hemolysin activation/secretion protein
MYRLILSLLGLMLFATSAVSQEAMTEEQATDAQVKFDVWEFQVEGATLLPKATVENVVYPFLGSGKRLADIEQARQALEQTYRDAGYAAVLVNIPEQDASHGVVRLQVIESKIERFRVSGTHYFSPRDLRAEIPSLQPGAPLHLPTLQAELAAATAVAPDRTLNPVFRPGLEPGSMEAELKVEERAPLHGNLGFNDRYTQGSTHLRMEAGVSYANLWQRHHNLSLNYQASPEKWDEVRVWMLGYAIPDEQARWSFSAIHSVSNSAALGTLGVLGDGDVYGVNWQRQLPGSEGVSQGLSLGVQYKDQRQEVLLPDGNGLSTPISYSVAQVQYNRRQQDEAGVTSYSLSGAFGLRILGNSEAEFGDKRFNAKANFSHLNGDLERAQAGFMKTTWRLHLAAQLSDSPLISNEQFNAGGVDTVRGYPESQAMGDDALLANLELRTPSLAPEHWVWLNDLQLLIFADSAWLKRHDPLASEAERQHLASAGVGARLVMIKSFIVALDWASPLEDAGSIKRSDARVHFNTRYEF